MAVKLTELGTRRFIGDTETMLVHDRWNSNCEDCLMDALLEKGVARGFNPDQSDQAFWEDYDYCPHCFDRTDPAPPAWARQQEGAGKSDAHSKSRNAAAEVAEHEHADEHEHAHSDEQELALSASGIES